MGLDSMSDVVTNFSHVVEGARRAMLNDVVNVGKSDRGREKWSGLGSKRMMGMKWSRTDFIHGLSGIASCDDSVHDSGFENMNRIFQNKGNIVVDGCNNLGLLFREPDEIVTNKVCKLIRKDCFYCGADRGFGFLMKIISSWNVWGLGDPHKRYNVRKDLGSIKADWLALQESKLGTMDRYLVQQICGQRDWGFAVSASKCVTKQ